MNISESLKADNGLIIGVDDAGKYYHTDGYQPLLLMAPTGAGKGVAFVIPNLVSCQDSAIVHDIKLENYTLTSGWRANQGQKIYVWEPLNPDGKTHCYNPLDFIRSEPAQMIDDLYKIAALLVANCRYNHAGVCQLFVALALYVLHDIDKKKSIGEIFRALIGARLSDELAKAINMKLPDSGKLFIKNFLQQEPQERAKISAALAECLELWGNPLIDRATERSDFNPANFRKEKSTLYVGLNPCDIDRLKPLMQFFYQHIAQTLTSDPLKAQQEPYGLLLFLDEFPAIGKMDVFTTCIPYFRGYKVRLLLIAQDLNHIRTTYCEKGTNSLLANSHFKIAFAANNYETAHLVAELCIDKMKKGVFMTWEAVMSLNANQQIILTNYAQPLLLKKLIYYNIGEFKDKVLPPAPLRYKYS